MLSKVLIDDGHPNPVHIHPGRTFAPGTYHKTLAHNGVTTFTKPSFTNLMLKGERSLLSYWHPLLCRYQSHSSVLMFESANMKYAGNASR